MGFNSGLKGLKVTSRLEKKMFFCKGLVSLLSETKIFSDRDLQSSVLSLLPSFHDPSFDLVTPPFSCLILSFLSEFLQQLPNCLFDCSFHKCYILLLMSHYWLNWPVPALTALSLKLLNFQLHTCHCTNLNPFLTSGTYTSHLQRVFSSPLG